MGARFVRIGTDTHGAGVEKGRIGQYDSGLFINEASGAAVAGGKHIRMKYAHARVEIVGGDVCSRQSAGARVDFEQPNLRLRRTKSRNKADRPGPGANIQNEPAGSGRRQPRQQQRVRSSPVSLRQLAETQPPTEQTIIRHIGLVLVHKARRLF